MYSYRPSLVLQVAGYLPAASSLWEYMCVLLVHHVYAWCLCRSEEGIGSLELELYGVVNHHKGAGNVPRSSGIAVSALNC